MGKIPLEKGMATHSSILAWRIPWTEEPAGCNPWDRKELDMSEQIMMLERSESINISFDTFYMENYYVLEIVQKRDFCF